MNGYGRYVQELTLGRNPAIFSEQLCFSAKKAFNTRIIQAALQNGKPAINSQQGMKCKKF